MCSIFCCTTKKVDYKQMLDGFYRTASRGPDMSRIEQTPSGYMAFHRLAIMGLNAAGMQPFSMGKSKLVCNGEIYGFRPLKRRLEALGYTFASDSDCEILLPLYHEYGLKMFSMLDAEYALVLYDGDKGEYIAARDPIGIRPLYYGYREDGAILFASEPKNLVGLCQKVMPFPPGHYYYKGKFHRYEDIAAARSTARTGWTRCAETSAKSWSRALKSGWMRTRRSGSSSRAGWTAPSSAPSAPAFWASPCAPSPSAWIRTRSTSNTRRRSPTT